MPLRSTLSVPALCAFYLLASSHVISSIYMNNMALQINDFAELRSSNKPAVVLVHLCRL